MRSILLLGLILGVSACSTTPPLGQTQMQYCETDQIIKKSNDKTVSSETTLTCSDSPVKKLIPPKMGLGTNCKEHWYSVNINGNMVERKGYACLFKGKDYESSRWYIVDSPY